MFSQVKTNIPSSLTDNKAIRAEMKKSRGGNAAVVHELVKRTFHFQVRGYFVNLIRCCKCLIEIPILLKK